MLRILIAILKFCICILKGIDKWCHERGIDQATQTDVSMIMPERNIPKSVPEGNIPKAVPEGNIPKAVPEGNIPKAAPEGNVPKAVPEGNVPKANPEGIFPKAAPVPMANPAPTRAGAAKAKSKAKAKANQDNKPCWAPDCPKCKAPMRLRTAHHGGMFYGCTTYPDCTGSRPPNYFEVPGTKED